MTQVLDGARPARVVRLIPVLDFGGVEAIFLLQAQRVERSRYDLRICTFWKDGHMAAQLRALGYEVDVLGVDPSIRNPEATLALYRYLAAQRPDIVHASIGEANFHAALVGKLAGVGGVILEEQGFPDRKPVGRAVHAVLYRLADQIVGVSDASCRYMIEREYAPASRVRRIYNAANADYFSPCTARPGRDVVEIVTVGRLVPVKNQAMLIDAFAPVARAYPHARLTIVGEGALKEALEAQVAALGLGGQVSLPGFRGDIKQVLDGADVFVLPSLSEGLGIALVEAMARAMPVVSTTAGGAGEVVAPLGEGWSVAPRDVSGWTRALERLVALSGEERAALGAQAHRRAQDFSPELHIEQLHRLYDEVLSVR